MNFRASRFCILYLFLLQLFLLQLDPAALSGAEPELSFRSIRQARIEGRGWTETKAAFDRLPAKAEGVVREPVWRLSRDSAGLAARFVTDAQRIDVRWTLRRQRLALPHMAATGVSGIDLYVRRRDGWRWLATARPTKFPANQWTLVREMSGQPREYLVYLPLYNGVEKVEIGLPAGASFERGPPRPAGVRPVVVYGTSIVPGVTRVA